MPRPQIRPDHIQPHRLWAYVCMESELSGPEHAHVSVCETCFEALHVCLRSPTFGAVLRELNKEDEE